LALERKFIDKLIERTIQTYKIIFSKIPIGTLVICKWLIVAFGSKLSAFVEFEFF
jgi:hypothetical protein